MPKEQIYVILKPVNLGYSSTQKRKKENAVKVGRGVSILYVGKDIRWDFLSAMGNTVLQEKTLGKNVYRRRYSQQIIGKSGNNKSISIYSFTIE